MKSLIRKISHFLVIICDGFGDVVRTLFSDIKNSYQRWHDADTSTSAQILERLHSPEKGFSLGSRTKVPFGSQFIAWSFPNAGFDQSEPLSEQLRLQARRLAEDVNAWNNSGGRIDPRHAVKSIAPLSQGTVAEILTSRASERVFSTVPPALAKVRLAIQHAQSAPSQCNRQATRIHLYTSRSHVAELLEMQGGAAGFSDAVPYLLVASYLRPAWTGSHERFGGYVDTGIFTLALLMALQGQQLASCPMNLSMTRKQEKRFKKHAEIDASETLVCAVAVGNPVATRRLGAKSLRLPVSKILTVHEGNS